MAVTGEYDRKFGSLNRRFLYPFCTCDNVKGNCAPKIQNERQMLLKRVKEETSGFMKLTGCAHIGRTFSMFHINVDGHVVSEKHVSALIANEKYFSMPVVILFDSGLSSLPSYLIMKKKSMIFPRIPAFTNCT